MLFKPELAHSSLSLHIAPKGGNYRHHLHPSSIPSTCRIIPSKLWCNCEPLLALNYVGYGLARGKQGEVGIEGGTSNSTYYVDRDCRARCPDA
jgi:hypothetical protein